MKMSRKLLLVFCLISVLFLPGCWNYREIDKLSIVSGIAVDKGEDGGYILSIEIIDMPGGKEQKMESRIIQKKGLTFFDAARGVVSVTAPKLYWSHSEILILSEEVAREGILQIIDFIYRDPEPRIDMAILVSQMKSAHEILQAKSITTEIRGYEIKDMLEAEKFVFKTPLVQIYEFYNAVAGEGISAVAGAVNLVDNNGVKTSQLNGTAIFSKDKLAGYLNQEDTFYFQYVTDEIKAGLIPLEYSTNEAEGGLSFEIFETHTSVRPVYENDELSMVIDIRTEVNLGENGPRVDYFDKKQLDDMTKALEEDIKKNIERVIKKVQDQWGEDIFGFGSKVHIEMPDFWKSIGKDWAKVFPELKAKVNVKTVLRNTAQVSKPLKVGD